MTSSFIPAVVTAAPIAVNAAADPSWDAWQLCSQSNGLDLNGQLCDPDALLDGDARRKLGAALSQVNTDTNCPCASADYCENGNRNYKQLVVVSRTLNQELV